MHVIDVCMCIDLIACHEDINFVDLFIWSLARSLIDISLVRDRSIGPTKSERIRA